MGKTNRKATYRKPFLMNAQRFLRPGTSREVEQTGDMWAQAGPQGTTGNWFLQLLLRHHLPGLGVGRRLRQRAAAVCTWYIGKDPGSFSLNLNSSFFLLKKAIICSQRPNLHVSQGEEHTLTQDTAQCYMSKTSSKKVQCNELVLHKSVS